MKKFTAILLTAATLSVQPQRVHAQGNPLSQEQKIFALSQIWKEMHYNFAFPERLKQCNIDSLYLAYLPKIEKAEGLNYYLTLQSFMVHFNDGHTRIGTPAFGYPQLTPRIFGDKIIIWNMPKSVAKLTPRGSEIIQIGGTPIQRYLQDSVYPYTPGAPQHRLIAAQYPMLRGAPQSVITLTIKTPDGKENNVQLPRIKYPEPYAEEWTFPDDDNEVVKIDVVANDIGYIKLRYCSPSWADTIKAIFENNLPRLRRCKGLIVDVRDNPGGSTAAWLDNGVIDYFILDTTYTMGKNLTRVHNARYKAYGTPDCSSMGGSSWDSLVCSYYSGTSMEESVNKFPVTLSDSLKLHQPLVVLANGGTASAAEDVVLVMREAKRGLIMGEPTAACMGNTLKIPLPGGLSAYIGANKVTYADGTDFLSTGIIPDIVVPQDLNAHLKGKDNVLERAIEELRKQTARSGHL